MTTPAVGQRVQTPVYSDAWMRGDRYGEVTKIHKPAAYFLPTWITVRLTTSGRERRFIANDCTPVCDGLPLDTTTCAERAAHM